MSQAFKRRVRAYAAGIAAALLALGLRAAVEPWLQGNLPYLLAFLGVAAAVWIGGTGPGLVAAVIGFFGANLVARGDWTQINAILGRSYPLAVLGFFLSSGAVIAFGASLRAAQARLEREVEVRRAAEEAARRSEQALLAVDRRRNEFIATLAHELRNPLAPLRNALQLLRLAGDDAAARTRALGVMERQLAQMVRLVDDLIDLGRISRDELQLRKAPVDLATVVRAACETSEPLIAAEGHRLELELPAEPVAVEADATRLTQVLANLLNNATKYTPAGGRLALRLRAREGLAEIVVEDSGIGIAAEMLPRVFEMFARVDRSTDTAQGGLGIGLAISRRLVELHGGSLVAESEGAGRGSRFTVRLPLALQLAASVVVPAPSASASGGGNDRAAMASAPASSVASVDPAAAIATTRARRILVVDDNVDAASSLRAMLELHGHEVRDANDGAAALEGAEAFRPEIALLDIGMPGMDGCELARRLRACPWADGLMLVAITGWGQQADRRRSAEAGFAHHLVKPVEPDELTALIARCAVRPAMAHA